MRPAGPIPNAAAAMEGSTKCLVAEVRIALLERKFGFHAGISSRTNIFSAGSCVGNVCKAGRHT